EWLGGPRVLVKRDDLTGLALGGNKARKLEFLCGEAQAAGCDVLVTGGGAQSNHARMTAAAASRLGFDCHLAVGGKEPGLYSGNLLLDRVLGVDVGTRPDLDDVIPRLAVEAAARAGRAAPREELVLDHSRFGDGYGAVTESALEAIDRVAGLEGVILDPVYTGKAMAGLIGAAREGRFGAGDTI